MLPLHHDPGRMLAPGYAFESVVMITPLQSGRPDSNRRSPAPKAGGLPGFPTSRLVFSTATRPRIRTAGFEPAISCSPRLADYQAFLRPVAIAREGVEPSSPP